MAVIKFFILFACLICASCQTPATQEEIVYEENDAVTISEYDPEHQSEDFEGLEEAYAQFLQETEIREQVEAQIYSAEIEENYEPDNTETPSENLTDEIPVAKETSFENEEINIEPNVTNEIVEIEAPVLEGNLIPETPEPSVIEKSEPAINNTIDEITETTTAEETSEPNVKNLTNDAEIVTETVVETVVKPENKIDTEPKEVSLLDAAMAFVKKIPLWVLLFPISIILIFIIRKAIPHKTNENEVQDNTILDAFCNGTIDIDREVQNGSQARDPSFSNLN